MKSSVVVVHADVDSMKTVVDPGPHQTYRNPRVSVECRELGKLRSDEVRVKMIFAGVCGTDIHLVDTNPDTGYIRCSAPARIPREGRVIGHEGVGRVLETGAHIRHVKAGDYVTFESIIVCHYCNACRRGDFNQCHNAFLLGFGKGRAFRHDRRCPGYVDP